MSTEQCYEAFISYSHGDRAWATWLLKALETYRVPARMVGTPSPRGPVPARLRPLFCDREELSASGELGATLTRSLAESSALIVICSPRAAGSRWVNEEVLAFKRAHGEGRVFCAIVDGDPAGTDQTGCFPPALRFRLGEDGQLSAIPIEPLAADLREQGDGRKLGKLKLVAGLLEIRLDSLVQREAQRRQRRLAWIAGAAMFGMLAMGALTLEAWRERREAVRQRAQAVQQRTQAEGLVEFLVGDLRKKLEPVGRLDVMDALGERALGYYASQDLTSLDADSLGRRARVLHMIGEMRSLRGNNDAAYRVFREAALSTAQLLARKPQDTQRMYDHAQSVFWVGYLAWQRGKFDEAQLFFRQYEALAVQLVKVKPDNMEWQMELSYARGNLGTADMDLDQVDAAATHFSEAIATSDLVLTGSPNDGAAQRQKAQMLAWLADAEARRGHWADVERERRGELAIYLALLDKDPKDNSVRQSLPVTYRALAQAALAQGFGEAALSYLAVAESACEQLRELDSGNTFWQELSVDIATNYADTLLWLGRPDAAGKELADADGRVAQLLHSDASVMRWQQWQLRVRLLQAHHQFLTGDRASAGARLSELAADVDRALDRNRDSRILRALHLDALALVAQLAEARGDETGRATAARQLLAGIDRDDPEPHLRFLHAQALSLAGRTGEASALATELWRQGYHHPELQALRRSLALTRP